MRAQVLPSYDPGPLDDLLLEDAGLGRVPYGQRIRAISAAQLAQVAHVRLRVWCHQRARYSVPTTELVEWLRDRIAGRPALEIGAGMGDLGRLIGIRMTDSAMQTTPEIRAYYAMLGAPVTDPPPDVERLEAIAAVEKYRPRVVIASWVTQLYEPGDDEASAFGVDERRLLSMVDTYIHIGHKCAHAKKRILALPHDEHALPFLFSRGADPTQNVVYVWGR